MRPTDNLLTHVGSLCKLISVHDRDIKCSKLFASLCLDCAWQAAQCPGHACRAHARPRSQAGPGPARLPRVVGRSPHAARALVACRPRHTTPPPLPAGAPAAGPSAAAARLCRRASSAPLAQPAAASAPPPAALPGACAPAGAPAARATAAAAGAARAEAAACLSSCSAAALAACASALRAAVLKGSSGPVLAGGGGARAMYC